MLVDWKNHGRLLIALIMASALHALIILGIRFEMPKPKGIDKALDVVLVVKPAPKPPVRAEYLAPEPQKGGGEAIKKAVPRAIPNLVPAIPPIKIVPKLAPPPRHIVEKEPVRPPKPAPVAEPEPMPEPEPVTAEEPAPMEKPIPPEKPKPVERPKIEETPIVEDKPAVVESPAQEETPIPVFETEPKQVMKQAKSEKKVAAIGGKKGRVEPAPPPRHFSADMLSQQIAEVTTEFNKSRDDQAKQKRMVYINSVNAHKYNAAAYEADWQEKVERIGNLNYPDEARKQNLTGNLLMAVGINADGSIYSIRIRQSSGEQVLDEAAERIVRMTAPFAPFPPELREEADVLVITRTWRFSVGNRIDTGR